MLLVFLFCLDQFICLKSAIKPTIKLTGWVIGQEMSFIHCPSQSLVLELDVLTELFRFCFSPTEIILKWKRNKRLNFKGYNSRSALQWYCKFRCPTSRFLNWNQYKCKLSVLLDIFDSGLFIPCQFCVEMLYFKNETCMLAWTSPQLIRISYKCPVNDNFSITEFCHLKVNLYIIWHFITYLVNNFSLNYFFTFVITLD